MKFALSKSKIFLGGCIFFIVGVAVASFLPIGWVENDLWWFIGMMASSAILILFWHNRKVRIITLVGLFLFLGLWRYSIGLPTDSLDKIWYYNGQVITAGGIICNEPDIRQNNQKLEICVFKTGELTSVSGSVLVTTNLYPSYDYGDEIEITCELQAPEKFQGFAYDRYLARYDIYSVCYYPQIKLISSGRGNFLYKNIFKFKNKVRGVMNYGLNEPESSLAKAIILGDKKGIPADWREIFSQAGISHIAAISGMHISIMAALIMGLLLNVGLSRKRAFHLASLFLIIYIIFIGLPASAMRAGLMGFLVLWAMNLGRLNKLTNSLVLAAAVLLIINPKLLRDDIGFQLSFLAVLGIAYFYPLLDKWTENKFKRFSGLLKAPRALVNITLAAQIFTLPLLAYNFSQVSVISPVSNLLVLWALPILIVFLLSAVALSFIFYSLAVVFFLPALILLKYIITISDWLVKIPYAYIEIDYLWWGWIVVYYAVVIWIVVKTGKKKQEETMIQNL